MKYAKMQAIVVHENLKFGDNTLNNERLSHCEHKISDKLLANCHWIVNCQIQFYMNNKAIVLLNFLFVSSPVSLSFLSFHISTKFNVVNSLNFDRVSEVSWYKNAPKALIVCPAFFQTYTCMSNYTMKLKRILYTHVLVKTLV